MDKHLGPMILYLAVAYYVIQKFTRSSEGTKEGHSE